MPSIELHPRMQVKGRVARTGCFQILSWLRGDVRVGWAGRWLSRVSSWEALVGPWPQWEPPQSGLCQGPIRTRRASFRVFTMRAWEVGTFLQKKPTQAWGPPGLQPLALSTLGLVRIQLIASCQNCYPRVPPSLGLSGFIGLTRFWGGGVGGGDVFLGPLRVPEWV